MRLLSPEAEVMRSLSNLYKPWVVHHEPQKTRVIDSNLILNDLLEKAAPVHAAEVDEDGFSAGLVAEDASNVLKAEPEIDYVQQAKDEAELILADARKQADGMIEQAKGETDGIRETARQEGLRDGQEELQRNMEELRDELEHRYQKKSQDLDREYNEKRENMEKDLVEVIIEVFNKVFHIQFDNKKEILIHLIDHAILNIEGEKKFRIKVAEDNTEFLESHKDEILDRVGHDITLEILPDSTMEGNGCIIETDSGVFDCSLGTQLENLIKDIRSLCS